jgi:selenide,water dikinase
VTTQAAAPAWFAATGLALDAAGFIAVGPTLQSLNDPDVFAAGDCAALIETPREKAGVYAVRAGPPLARNLRLRASGKPARPWTPQQRHLALISAGPHYAVASRGPLKLEGAWLWTLKDRIDRRWMRMYQDADRLRERMALAAKAAGTPAVDPDEAMRCGGCAAKVGPDPLARALARLPPAAASDVVLGLERADDAAVLRAPVGRHLVQTVDFFRGFFDDPFVLGEIAANHALNDIFAMGGAATHALAIAVVPPGKPAKVEDELVQLLSGARRCFDREGVALVGGHSSEGERAVGFSVSGNVDPGRIVRKSGLKPGDALILTRPIGTGILFAAHMRGRARAAWIEPALAAMTRSNREAARILIDHGAGAMTDVTGFGLAGHLGEMLSASVVNAGLDLSCVPLYAGALTLAQEGIASTLLPDNQALARRLRTPADAAALALLFDPQTSGGLLAGVPAPRAAACVAALQAAGCESSCVVGHVAGAAQAARDAGLHLRGAFGSPPPRP